MTEQKKEFSLYLHFRFVEEALESNNPNMLADVKANCIQLANDLKENKQTPAFTRQLEAELIKILDSYNTKEDK